MFMSDKEIPLIDIFTEHFVNKHHPMQENRNNCFGHVKKKYLLTSKSKLQIHCRFFISLVLKDFYLTKSRITLFRSERTAARYLHLIFFYYYYLLNFFKHIDLTF